MLPGRGSATGELFFQAQPWPRTFSARWLHTHDQRVTYADPGRAAAGTAPSLTKSHN